MTRTYERVAITIIALSALFVSAIVVKKELFSSRGAEVSIGIWCCEDPSWWNPRYGPVNVAQRWTFGGAHSYTTRELMGQRL